MMIKNLVKYVKDDNFQFKYVDCSINIVNYLEIKTLSDNLISLIDKKGNMLLIKGNNLILKRMVSDEVLITGNIKTIEM